MSRPHEPYQPLRCAVYACPNAPCATERVDFRLPNTGGLGFCPLCEAHAREAYAEGRKMEWWAEEDAPYATECSICRRKHQSDDRHPCE